MDYTMLIILAVVAAVFGLTLLATYLRTKNIVTAEDLVFASNTLSLSIAIISELNLQHEEKIKDISTVVADSVHYVIANMKVDADRVSLAYEHAIILCKDLKLNLTEERKDIIRQLIELSFSRLSN